MARTDQFFKTLVQQFLPELLRLFLPEDARHLDFSTLRFLGTEVWTNWPRGRGRRVDVLAEVRTLAGEPETIAVHIEIQARSEAEFADQMWKYYIALRLRLDVPVLPVALMLAPGSGGLTEQRHVEQLFGREIVSFRYASIGLRDLDAEAYHGFDEPLAQALRT